MRVAALYDIHGNLPALEAVLAEPDVAAADRVVVGGDALEPGRCRPRRCACSSPSASVIAWVRGNTERELIERRGADPDEGGCGTGAPRGPPDGSRRRTWPIADLARSRPCSTIDGLGAVLFCHATPAQRLRDLHGDHAARALAPMLAASPRRPSCAGTPTSSSTARSARSGRERRQRRHALRGCCPRPTGACSGPTSSCARTDYDLAAAAERIRATELPDAEGSSADGPRPASAEEATTEFEAMARGRRVTGADGRPHCHLCGTAPRSVHRPHPVSIRIEVCASSVPTLGGAVAMVSIAGGSTRRIHTRSSCPCEDAACRAEPGFGSRAVSMRPLALRAHLAVSLPLSIR